MGDANATTARALNFGLESSGHPEEVAAELVVAAGHDRRPLRIALGRIERGCGQDHSAAEDRALSVLRLALVGDYISDLGLFDVGLFDVGNGRGSRTDPTNQTDRALRVGR